MIFIFLWIAHVNAIEQQNERKEHDLLFKSVNALKMQHYALAKSNFLKLANNGNLFAFFYLGVIYEKGYDELVDYTKAFNSYNRVIKSAKLIEKLTQNKNYKDLISKTQNNLANLYWIGQGVTENKQKALELYNKAAKNGSINALLTLGVIYMEGTYVKKNTEKAKSFFETVASNNNAAGYYNLAVLYQSPSYLNHLKEVEYNLNKASELGNIIAKNDLAYIYAQKNKQLKKAEKLIKEALEKAPNNSLFLDTLGFIYFKQKKYDESKRIFELLLKNNPLNIEARGHYALLLKDMGDKIESQYQLSAIDAIKIRANKEKERNDPSRMGPASSK